MAARKSYIFLFPLLLVLIAGLILWQAGGMIKERRKEEQIWLVTAEKPEGEISQEELFTMKEFSGLENIWTVIQTEAEMKVKSYMISIAVQGVDLTTYPIKTVRSAGKKTQGAKLLLAVGEDFFEQMKDESGMSVSERQAKVLMEEVGDLKAELRLNPEEADIGAFLGVVEGNGVYMGQEEMKQWLSAKGIHPGVSKVCMEIRGEKRAERAIESLEKAGFLAEKKQE